MEKDKKKSKYRRYGKIIYFLLNIITKTMKKKTVINDKVEEDTPYIYAFWHEKIVSPTISLTHVEKKTTLVSPSNDGELLEEILKKYGYEVIRGSSNDKSIRSLMAMIKQLRKGYSLGFAVDGPKGPIYKIKPGILFMAQKTGVKILPVGGAFSRKRIFEKAWDKFQWPKLFSKSVCYLGEPIEIPKDVNPEDYLEIVNEKIHQANKEAERILNE